MVTGKNMALKKNISKQKKKGTLQKGNNRRKKRKITKGGESQKEREYRGKGVASIGNKHASLANSAVADSDALNEPGGAHFHWPISGLSSTSRSISTLNSMRKMGLPLSVLILILCIGNRLKSDCWSWTGEAEELKVQKCRKQERTLK